MALSVGVVAGKTHRAKALTGTLLLIALVVAVVGSLGAPLITAVAVVLAAFLLFATFRTHLAGPLSAMALLGLGVGAFSAAMPAVILEVTPAGETASAMGVNQVVRSIGFSLGSTLSALILSAYTGESAVFPTSHGYGIAAWTGVGITALALGIGLTTGNAGGPAGSQSSPPSVYREP